jgi:hypothetical protein
MAIIDAKRFSTKTKDFIFKIRYVYPSLFREFRTKHLLQVKLNIWPIESINFFVIYNVTICDVNCLIGKIIDNCLQVTTGEAWEQLSRSKFSGDTSMILRQKLTLNN